MVSDIMIRAAVEMPEDSGQRTLAFMYGEFAYYCATMETDIPSAIQGKSEMYLGKIVENAPLSATEDKPRIRALETKVSKLETSLANSQSALLRRAEDYDELLKRFKALEKLKGVTKVQETSDFSEDAVLGEEHEFSIANQEVSAALTKAESEIARLKGLLATEKTLSYEKDAQIAALLTRVEDLVAGSGRSADPHLLTSVIADLESAMTKLLGGSAVAITPVHKTVQRVPREPAENVRKQPVARHQKRTAEDSDLHLEIVVGAKRFTREQLLTSPYLIAGCSLLEGTAETSLQDFVAVVERGRFDDWFKKSTQGLSHGQSRMFTGLMRSIAAKIGTSVEVSYVPEVRYPHPKKSDGAAAIEIVAGERRFSEAYFLSHKGACSWFSQVSRRTGASLQDFVSMTHDRTFDLWLAQKVSDGILEEYPRRSAVSLTRHIARCLGIEVVHELSVKMERVQKPRTAKLSSDEKPRETVSLVTDDEVFAATGVVQHSFMGSHTLRIQKVCSFATSDDGFEGCFSKLSGIIAGVHTGTYLSWMRAVAEKHQLDGRGQRPFITIYQFLMEAVGDGSGIRLSIDAIRQRLIPLLGKEGYRVRLSNEEIDETDDVGHGSTDPLEQLKGVSLLGFLMDMDVVHQFERLREAQCLDSLRHLLVLVRDGKLIGHVTSRITALNLGGLGLVDDAMAIGVYVKSYLPIWNGSTGFDNEKFLARIKEAGPER